MTLEEAKEILIEKGYSLKKVKNCHPSQVDCFVDKVLKCAVATVNANGYMVGYHNTVNVTTQEFIDAANEHNKTVVSDYAQFMKWAHEHYDDFLKSKDGQVDCQDGEPVKKNSHDGDECMVGASMSFQEAKEILDSEMCFCIEKATEAESRRKVTYPDWEKTCVKEAIIALGKLGYQVFYNLNYPDYRYREELLKKEGCGCKNDKRPDYEKVNEIVDKLIEEEGEPVKGEHLNPALHDSAKQFNDALLDEQSKKIKELEEKNIRLSEKVSSLHSELGAERISNKVISKKNKKIAFLKKRIKEKDEVIEDISEELRLSKVREDELIETVKDYLALVGEKDEEIKKLKKQLAQAEKRHFAKQKFTPHEAELAMKATDSIVIVKAPF